MLNPDPDPKFAVIDVRCKCILDIIVNTGLAIMYTIILHVANCLCRFNVRILQLQSAGQALYLVGNSNI